MYIVSSINPQTKSPNDVPVVLLCHEQKRKFVRRANTYEDMERTAREELGLGPDTILTFETSTLDACMGLSTQIGKSAYEAMSSCLDVLFVASTGTRSIQYEAPRIQARAGLATPSLTPASTYNCIHERNDGGKDVLSSSIRAPHPRQKTLLDVTEDDMGDENDSNPGPEESIFDDESSAASYDSDDGEQLENEFGRNPKRTDRATASAAPERVVVKEEHRYDEPTRNAEAATPKRKVRNGGNQTEFATVKDERQWDMVANETSVAAAATPRRRVRIEERSFVANKENASPLRKSSVKAGSRQTHPSDDDSMLTLQTTDDPRYKVTISGPGPDQRAEFKTRGKHSVKKVLAGACNQFDLDYNKAHLVLVVEVEDRFGLSERRFECAKEDTMAKAGVEEGAVLFIEMDDE